MAEQGWSCGAVPSYPKYNCSAPEPAMCDNYIDYGEISVDDDLEVDYPCPFCSECFDIVGLCCHMEEEHPIEASKGFCPMCATNVGVDMVEHVALQHENLYRSQSKAKSEGDLDSAIYSLLAKELKERSLKPLGLEVPSSNGGFASNAVSDMLLTSFIFNYPETSDAKTEPSTSSSPDTRLREEHMDKVALERAMENLSTNDENREEKVERSKFVQSILLSTMLDDVL